ncbi:sodium:calcium antiporter [Halorubraceae archaeon YAN]|nr:sodium:calcium antiporter [Halorubraceae archaeon YAN]
MSVVSLLALAIASTAVIWKGSELLERSARRLSRHYGVPAAVHGAVVVAIGSSFPELSSIIISTLIHNEFSLGVGAIVGSAIFNLLVIPAASAAVSEKFSTTRDIVHKDAQFYIISILVLFLTFALGATYIEGGTDTEAILTRPLVLIPLLTYGVYVFLQFQDTRDYVSPVTPDIELKKEWATLIVGLAVIAIGVEGIVRAALGFGSLFGASPFLWGLTVIAAGTSLPDAFVSVRAAKQDEDVTSLTNVLGSNTFNLLVAIPVGVLIVGTTTVNFALAIPMLGFLAFATIVFVVFTRTDLEITNAEAATFIGLYLLFLLWMFLETAGIVNTVQGI